MGTLQKHQKITIDYIRSFKGPQEGDLLVLLRIGKNEYGMGSPEWAITTVVDNPRLVFQALEKWKLN